MVDVDIEELAYAVALLVARLDVEHPWRRDALCREYETAIFFPARGESAEPARQVCARCVVRVECASYVGTEIRFEERCHGVWAGTSGRDRRRARWVATKPAKPSRVPCELCGGLLPAGRVGRCCDCVEAA